MNSGRVCANQQWRLAQLINRTSIGQQPQEKQRRREGAVCGRSGRGTGARLTGLGCGRSIMIVGA